MGYVFRVEWTTLDRSDRCWQIIRRSVEDGGTEGKLLRDMPRGGSWPLILPPRRAVVARRKLPVGVMISIRTTECSSNHNTRATQESTGNTHLSGVSNAQLRHTVRPHPGSTPSSLSFSFPSGTLSSSPLRFLSSSSSTRSRSLTFLLLPAMTGGGGTDPGAIFVCSASAGRLRPGDVTGSTGGVVANGHLPAASDA